MQKLLTNKQLSKIFQSALLLHILILIIDLLTTYFLPTYQNLEFYFYILEELSVFIISCIIISQTLHILIHRHYAFITKYKLVAITLAFCISTFIFWLLTIESDIQESFIEFIGSVSIPNHNYKVLIIYLISFILLTKEFYETLQNPEHINEKSIPKIIRSTFQFVVKEYLLIFISLFGFAHIQKIYKFSVQVLLYSKASIISQLTFLEIIIPITWICAILYYFYQKIFTKNILNFKGKI